MSCFPFCANSGIYFATGSLMRNLPCSHSCMTAVVVAITFVSDAQSNTVSSVIASRRGSRARCPYAFRWTTFPSCPTIKTAPGICPSAIALLMMGSRALSRDSSDVCAKPVVPEIKPMSKTAGRRIFALRFTCVVTVHDAAEAPQAHEVAASLGGNGRPFASTRSLCYNPISFPTP